VKVSLGSTCQFDCGPANGPESALLRHRAAVKEGPVSDPKLTFDDAASAGSFCP